MHMPTRFSSVASCGRSSPPTSLSSVSGFCGRFPSALPVRLRRRWNLSPGSSAPHDVENLPLRLYVDPSRRFIEKEHARARVEPFRDDNLLLIPPLRSETGESTDCTAISIPRTYLVATSRSRRAVVIQWREGGQKSAR